MTFPVSLIAARGVIADVAVVLATTILAWHGVLSGTLVATIFGVIAGGRLVQGASGKPDAGNTGAVIALLVGLGSLLLGAKKDA